MPQILLTYLALIGLILLHSCGCNSGLGRRHRDVSSFHRVQLYHVLVPQLLKYKTLGLTLSSSGPETYIWPASPRTVHIQRCLADHAGQKQIYHKFACFYLDLAARNGINDLLPWYQMSVKWVYHDSKMSIIRFIVKYIFIVSYLMSYMLGNCSVCLFYKFDQTWNNLTCNTLKF
jgi:hypothetical protein